MTDSDAAGDRPGDQAAVCPSWCVGDHDPGEGDEDRLHCSRSILVPGIILMSRHQREGDQQSRDVTTFDADSPGLTDGRIELPGGDASNDQNLWMSLGEAA